MVPCSGVWVWCVIMCKLIWRATLSLSLSAGTRGGVSRKAHRAKMHHVNNNVWPVSAVFFLAATRDSRSEGRICS